MSILFSLLTNPVTISVLVLCVLCLTGLNVLLSMLIACIIGGVAGGIPLLNAPEGTQTVMQLLTGGFANVDMAILGKEAKKKFFADANVQKMMDNRRMNMGEINLRDLPNGVKYLGHLNDPSLDMYVYGEVYYDDWTNPDAPETKPLIPDNMIILISSRPNYMMAYGACTYIEDASGLWVTSQTSRVLRSYVEHHPDRRMVELQAHPLPIPDKVDSWLVATVC